MEKVNENEKKLNLIKCPLPKIIYTSINGQPNFAKKSVNTSNNNTYYSRKINNRSPGLPSLKTNAKFSSSPNKTNYVNIKITNNINNYSNIKNLTNNNAKIHKINNNKDVKKQNLKELLNCYGLNKYYDKIVELGLNDENYTNLGLMNKKAFNEFISNIKMFSGHIIKMEQLYQHLKQINSYNKQLHNNSSLKNNNNINNNNENNNGVNYVTISFNRNINNNNIASKIMHSQSQNKYRFINPTIKSKNYNINNISSGKMKPHQQQKANINSKYKTLNKSKSKNKIDNNTDNIFEFRKPSTGGKNILIKYFFQDLSNYVNNISDIMNNANHNQKFGTNNKNFNKTNNNNSSNINNLNQDKKLKDFSNTFNENHLSNINMKEINPSDLPSINNKKKINTHYNKSLVNSINPSIDNNLNSSPKLEKKNKGVGEAVNKNKKNKYNNNDKLDKSKTINYFQLPYNINAFMKEQYIQNLKNNLYNNNNKSNLNENFKNSNMMMRKTQNENLKKNNIKINNSLKLKLPNVMNKTDFKNSLYISKIKQKPVEEKNSLNQEENIVKKQEKEDKNKKSNDINLKNVKTILIKKKKNDALYNVDNIYQKVKSNEKLKETENNTVVIKSWDDNPIAEEEKPIRLREKYENNLKNNEKSINIKEENLEQIKNNEKNQNKDAANNNESNKGITNNNINEMNSQMNLVNNNNLSQKIEIIPSKNLNKENGPKTENPYNLEDLIYENLRLNRSFSEDKSQNIFSFDLEFICRCLSLCLSILIETSKESPHITEINLEALSASNIKYFFFNEIFNENINILFDLFDKEVNKNINENQISPLDKLESILSESDENINFDIHCLKHIKKENDDLLIKKEEEKDKNQEKVGRDNFRLRPVIGDIEKDIRFIDEFFSINSRKKKAINYQHVSDISKNILCKELSYINEIDSELNGTNNSNINNTNFINNSNNNINDSIKGRKNEKESNNSNIIDNEEIKEIKEINDNDEEINNIFNNEMNELGINTENNDENQNIKEIKKSISNNNINHGIEDINIDNKKEEKEDLKSFEICLNEDNKILSSPINDKNIKDNEENKINNNIDLINKDINKEDNSQKNYLENFSSNKITENSDNIIVTINSNNNKNINIHNKKESNNNQVSKNETLANNSNLSKNNKINQNAKEQEEDDIYESDYIIDINSIDELTYYLIKRSEIFDEDFNYLIMKIAERRYIPSPEPQTIFDFMADIIILTKMEKEVIILSLIYIERLIFNTGLLLNSRNWRRILLTAMIIASKIWDDNSFENSHFSQVFANLGVGEINTLERIFLELINYKVFVKQSEYFKYLLMIKIIALKYNYNGREIVPASIIKNIKYQEFTETMQNRMRKKVTLNNSAQF